MRTAARSSPCLKIETWGTRILFCFKWDKLQLATSGSGGRRRTALRAAAYVWMLTRPSAEPGEMREVCGARQWSM
ncbi:hypothetical protein GCM10011586_15290 [Silvibacterium dinghuense]|nr:hypothetical protein GCM10011586_15290 [Silvibacterium dinghuense]